MTRTTPLLVALALAVPVLAVVPAAAANETCFDLPVNVLGTEGPDVIDLSDGSWGPGPFVVSTLGGDDLVIGSPGDDVVCLGDGDDKFHGRGGDDKADGGPGNDLLRGGPGNDTLLGGPGDDVIRGGPGDDLIDGGPGNDLIWGGAGNDTITGGTGDDQIRGGAGNDLIDGGPGNDLIWGGAGDDDIDGGAGNDVIRGGAGNDLLDGDGPPWVVPASEVGVDRIYGGTGNDRLFANWTFSDGDHTGLLRGGPGYDACALGAQQIDCERSEGHSSQGGAEWRPMVEDVFARWGLDQEKCGTINGAEFCVGPQVDNAIPVLMCESSGWPWSYHTVSGASGLFQNLQLYWKERVAQAINLAAANGITTTLTPGAYIFDPVANTEVAAFLVYTSRDTILGVPTSWSGSFPNSYNPGTEARPFPHYPSNWHQGPEPWGHWVCADPGMAGLVDPAWIHPGANL